MKASIVALPARPIMPCGTTGLTRRSDARDTPEQYIDRLVAVFHELKRVLRPDGTFWLNIAGHLLRHRQQRRLCRPEKSKGQERQSLSLNRRAPELQAKRFNRYSVAVGVCSASGRVVFTQRHHLAERKSMPESCKDRPSRCYEHIFLLAKSKQYFYDAAAIAEPIAPTDGGAVQAGTRSPDTNTPRKVPDRVKCRGINKARERRLLRRRADPHHAEQAGYMA